MAKTFVQEGKTIDYLNAGSAISAGDVIAIGNMLGVALEDIAATTGVGSVMVEGVFDLPKLSTAVISQGELPDWNATLSRFEDVGFVAIAGDVTGGAIAILLADNPSSTVRVKLLPGSGILV